MRYGFLANALGLAIAIFFGANAATAGGFLETRQVSIPDTVDNGSWVFVPLTRPFVNPVVVAGPLSHNNGHSLFVRIRNVSPAGFEIGMQSPCEQTGTYNGPDVGDPPTQAVCPPAAGWVAETTTWLAMEQGAWEFPDGREAEANLHTTTTVRSSAANVRDQVPFAHVYPSSTVAVFASVETINDGRFIHVAITNDTASTTPPAPTAADNDFGLALEGMEVYNSIGTAETIGWIALDAGSGVNAGIAYDAGRSPNLPVDRHRDGCFVIGPYATGASTIAVGALSSMAGGNGAGARLCGAGVTATNINIHADEDQDNDAERTGIPEYGSWFAYGAPGIGALDFLTASLQVSDGDSDGNGEPGETLTYTAVITNQLNDFAQSDNAGPEFVVPLGANVTFDSVVSASAGALGYNAGLNQMEWNGSVPASGSVTLTYTVIVNADVCASTEISTQGTLNMDPNADGANAIPELSDDPAVDIGGDIDGDTLTGDDDPTNLPIACPAIGINDATLAEGNAATTAFTFTVSIDGGGTAIGDIGFTIDTADGTATVADSDYTSLSGVSGTILAGNNSSTVTVNVTGDIAFEPDENFFVNLSNATGATLTDNQGTGTITNDDTPRADLSITKSDSAATYTPGTSTTYTITVNNAGPDDSPGASISDTFPPGLTLASPWTCTASGGGSCGASSGGVAGDSGFSDTPDLPVGGSVVYTVPVMYSATDADY